MVAEISGQPCMYGLILCCLQECPALPAYSWWALISLLNSFNIVDGLVEHLTTHPDSVIGHLVGYSFPKTAELVYS